MERNNQGNWAFHIGLQLTPKVPSTGLSIQGHLSMLAQSLCELFKTCRLMNEIEEKEKVKE